MSGAYANIIKSIDPKADADLVEMWMRLEYGTLDHLPRDVFVREINLCSLLTEDEIAQVKRSYAP